MSYRNEPWFIRLNEWRMRNEQMKELENPPTWLSKAMGW